MAQRRIYILYILATAIMLLTGCADNTYLGDQDGAVKGTNEAIAFDGGFKAVTRAGKVGADAADLLGNQFIVSGVKVKGSATQNVFQNYTVNWTANTAGTTTTNSSDWEYAGLTYLFDTPGYDQTIKYWDFSQDYYNFAAYSVGNNAMVVKKKENSTNNGVTEGDAPAANTIYVTPFNYDNVTGWPYFLRGSKDDLAECYITDMTTVPQADYGKPVVLKFRPFVSKVRMALYETIPGYSIKDVRFYESTNPTAGADPEHDTKTTATLFGVNAFVTKGTYKVYFPHVGSANVGDPDYNKAHAGHEPGNVTLASKQEFGNLNYSGRQRLETEGNYYLGRSAASPTFAGSSEDNYYVKMLPYEETTQNNLELRVDYTLVSLDGNGETIKVYGAHAFVPSIYARWKPGYAYTYIFKISDNQNGWTNPSLVNRAGLFPITFDAVSLSDEDTGQQTTITTVASPSITTYQKGHTYDVDYKLPTASTTDDDDIYVQVMDVASKTLKTDLNGSNKSLFYKITKESTDYVASEGEVLDALNLRTSGNAATIVGVNGVTLTPSTINNEVTTIPGASGNITVNAGEAAKLTPTTAGTYAYVYDTGTYYPVTSVTLTTQPNGWPYGYYTDAECNTAATTFAAGNYYQRLKVYGVKVIKIVT